MSEIRDGLENVAEKVQEGVDRAIAGAKDVYEKAKPYIEDGIEMVKDGAQSLYERVKPAIENLTDNSDKTSEVREEINREVEEQVQKIRESAVTPTPFTEYIRQNFGKKDGE